MGQGVLQPPKRTEAKVKVWWRGAQSVCSRHSVTARFDYMDCSLECEFHRRVSRSACGLEYERDEFDVLVSVEFALLSSLGHVSWSGADC